jgi:NAD(P)H-dependent flavin oxidoreductase YrpB (nitropropane dioxygenase family)
MCSTFGIEYPIFAFSHCRDVVAAVTNAGGLGVLGTARKPPEEFAQDLVWIAEHVHGRPFGVDVLMPAHGTLADRPSGRADRPIPPDARAFLDDLLRRFDVPELPQHLREQLDADLAHRSAASYLDIAFDHEIKLLVSALGSPPPDVLQRAHEKGVLVGALAGSRVHAEQHHAAGVDIIIAQGTEAGGHTGDISTMVHVPETVDAVAPTPVLAAGGIARGRQVAAALALGAQGVWCGSVWLTTVESDADPAAKEKLLRATSRDTVRSRSWSGKPVRMLRSAWTEAWDDPSTPAPPPFGAFRALTEEAFIRIERASANREGAYELRTYPVGQVVGQMNIMKTTRQVLLEMVDEYTDVLSMFMAQADAVR